MVKAPAEPRYCGCKTKWSNSPSNQWEERRLLHASMSARNSPPWNARRANLVQSLNNHQSLCLRSCMVRLPLCILIPECTISMHFTIARSLYHLVQCIVQPTLRIGGYAISKNTLALREITSLFPLPDCSSLLRKVF